MAQVQVGGITLEVEDHGDKRSPVVLLIMGLGAQLTRWPMALVEAIAARGFRVVRFDNRDVGLSQKFDAHCAPDLRAVAADPSLAPYTLDHMAEDAVGVLDALGIDKAHVVGASMGGMIAQLVAANHPERVLSLTSIMSTTGNPALPRATAEANAVLTQRPPEGADLDALVEHGIKSQRVIGSPAWFDEARERERLRADYRRSHHPVGFARQMAAIIANGDRRPKLAGITAPTMVVHGDVDPLVPLDGGRDTAASIPGAELRIIEGMGHDVPPQIYDRLADAIADVATRASSPPLRSGGGGAARNAP